MFLDDFIVSIILTLLAHTVLKSLCTIKDQEIRIQKMFLKSRINVALQKLIILQPFTGIHFSCPCIFSVTEGLALYNAKITPYEGDMFHEVGVCFCSLLLVDSCHALGIYLTKFSL